MNGHTQPRFLHRNGSATPGPQLPACPIPSGPPPQFLVATGNSADGVILSDGYRTSSSKRRDNQHSQQELTNLNGHNRSSSRGALSGFHASNSLQSSDSPHTDISFIQQSSDGTNGSSKGRMTLNRASPPRHILDFVPPPPPVEPPAQHFDHINHPNGCYRVCG